MKASTLPGLIFAAAACLAIGGRVHADTIQTFGAGSAVTFVDRSTTFDNLDSLHNGTSLSDYTSNGILIGTDGGSFSGNGPGSWPYFNPFHITTANPPGPPPSSDYQYPGGGFYFPQDGSQGWTTIEATDSKRIFGLEFLYGNGWTTGDIDGLRTGFPWGSDGAYVEWQSLVGGSVVSSGVIGPNPILPVGTVLGFYDPNGFDQLMVRSLHPNSADPSIQALALDNLKLQFRSVPEPSSMILLGSGVGLIAFFVRRSGSARR